MKRYIKYGLIIITTLAAIGLIFYVLKKPKELVFKKIPADVSYCLTMNKLQFYKHISSIESVRQDSFLSRFNNKIPKEALQVFNTAGINPFSDMAFFGKNEKMNFAWTGNNLNALLDTIQAHKWPVEKLKGFDQVKISDKLYLSFDWPIMLLSNYHSVESIGFFSKTTPKLNKKDIIHSKTEHCIVYGFIIPDTNITNMINYLPLKGKAYIGVNINKRSTEIFYVQPKVKLKGKLGCPKILPTEYAVLSWPLSVKTLSNNKQLPETIISSLAKSLKKPVSHLYGEVLDTVSFTERIVTYDMDIEFKLTQKVVYALRMFPGLHFEFVKSVPERDSFFSTVETKTDLGLPVLKLYFMENPKAYILSSETDTKKPGVNYLLKKNLPTYYIFANIELLNSDPFWVKYTNTNYKKLQFYADSLERGSMFILKLHK